jgi:hypothetical protein
MTLTSTPRCENGEVSKKSFKFWILLIMMPSDLSSESTGGLNPEGALRVQVPHESP